MKLIVCGGRQYRPSPEERLCFWHLLEHLMPSDVYHGDAPGVDRTLGRFAADLGFRVTSFPANWSHGRQAGPVRNATMALSCVPGDACVAFSGGAGTADMVRRAQARGLRIFDWRLE